MRRAPDRVFARIGATTPPTQPRILLDQAVVLGASVAGLLAARVLADHAESVVIIDREGPADGVPQRDQVHTLLPAGRVQLDRWFPGFSGQAVAEGALLAPSEARRTYMDGVPKVRGSEAEFLTLTRPFLQELIRRRTLELPNVKTVTGRATDLEFDGDAVSGVRYATAAGDGVKAARFVVDAMGRSSRLSEWLEQNGWERPPMQRMTININYATAEFRRPGTPRFNAVLALRDSLGSSAGTGAVLGAVERHRWQVMMGGYDTNRPGHTRQDLLRRCREEFPPEFAEVAANEMLGEVRTYRQADSRRRDYHLLKRFPARLVSVGDAVASFNPIYGQGMSSAALHASCLSLYLRSGPDLSAPAREFLALQRVVVDAAWSTSTSADLALPHVDGPYPRGYRVSRWISDQIITASRTDPEICRRFDEVAFMLAHPRSLVTPGTVLRALLANWRARRSRTMPARAPRSHL